MPARAVQPARPRDAHKLKDKRDSDAHVSNYCAIEPTMRALKIKFDAQVASALMGATGREPRAVPAQDGARPHRELHRARLRRREGRPKPLCSLPTRGPSRTDREHALFESAVRRMVENHNGDHLQRFDDEAARVDARLERQKAKLFNLDQHTMQTHAKAARARAGARVPLELGGQGSRAVGREPREGAPPPRR